MTDGSNIVNGSAEWLNRYLDQPDLLAADPEKSIAGLMDSALRATIFSPDPGKFAKMLYIPGAATANVNCRFSVSAPCRMVHVSVVGSNANDATIMLGLSSDPDGFLKAAAVGDSDVPAVFTVTDFDGDLIPTPGVDYPELDTDDIFVITVDFDGLGGTAVNNLTVVLEFIEGVLS